MAFKLSPAEIAQRFLNRPHEKLDDAERAIIDAALAHKVSTPNSGKAYDKAQTFGDRVADGIARVGGSWPFIIGFVISPVFWTIANAWLLGRETFDPYPFVFLNLVLSMIAALQAPIIMMSQNRQTERDRIDAQHDYEVNLKAEIEILGLHEKLDALRLQELALIRQELQEMRAVIQALSGDARISKAP